MSDYIELIITADTAIANPYLSLTDKLGPITATIKDDTLNLNLNLPETMDISIAINKSDYFETNPEIKALIYKLDCWVWYNQKYCSVEISQGVNGYLTPSTVVLKPNTCLATIIDRLGLMAIWMDHFKATQSPLELMHTLKSTEICYDDFYQKHMPTIKVSLGKMSTATNN